MPPSPVTKMLKRLMTAVRNVLTLMPQSLVDGRSSEDGWLDMGECSFALGKIVGSEWEQVNVGGGDRFSRRDVTQRLEGVPE
jgi:hypothetical protein